MTYELVDAGLSAAMRCSVLQCYIKKMGIAMNVKRRISSVAEIENKGKSSCPRQRGQFSEYVCTYMDSDFAFPALPFRYGLRAARCPSPQRATDASDPILPTRAMSLPLTICKLRVAMLISLSRMPSQMSSKSRIHYDSDK